VTLTRRTNLPKGRSAVKIRKASNTLTVAEWENFVCAYKNLREGLFKGVAKPSLDDFADEHADAFKDKHMDWHVHTMPADADRPDWGVLFFAWHRMFLNEFENRLRREVPGVTIPYWNAFKEPFPEELKKISDNDGAVISPSQLHLPNFDEPDFEKFQHDFEVGYHNDVHAILGGTVGRAHSPRDATFWLHHAFVDRQWGHWFEKHNGALPPTMEQSLHGDTIVTGKKVKDVLHTTQLDYVYGNGIYNNVASKGSDTFAATAEKGMILCASYAENLHAKIHVAALSNVALFLTLQPFMNGIPMAKLGVFPPDTGYVDLKAGKFDVPKEQGHIHIFKKPVGSGFSYIIEAVNGTRLAIFTEITDFTADDGKGASDYEMLYI